MKLNYSTSLITSIYLHIIFIHIIYTHLCLASADQSTTYNNPYPENFNYYEHSQENKKSIDEKIKAQLLKEVLGLKEVPKKARHKAYVSHAILEQYRENREKARESIPDDRDYYGKINIDDLDNFHGDFFGSSYRLHGGRDVPVDMTEETEAVGHKFLFKRDVNQISQIHCQQEPEEVPPPLAKKLQPYYSQGQFFSVHLKFNLSQELFINPLSVDDFEGAELHLGRERWFDCKVEDESKKKRLYSDPKHESISSSVHHSTGTTSLSVETSSDDTTNPKAGSTLCNGLRYQRIYILPVRGYTQDNEPITSVHDNQRIDSVESTELMFDIKDIVQTWIEDPKTNHGIIVRVSYDEDDLKKLRYIVEKSSANNSSNASVVPNRLEEQLSGLRDHVRLQRGFQSSSETEEAWSKKQPTIFIFSDPPGRRHVKRDSVNRNPSVRSQSSATTNNQKTKRKKSSRGNEKCSMKTMSINFDDVGWSNWIIAPTSYFANYCSGDCSHPLLDVQNATNHAIIQSIYHSVGRVVPRSCCAPIRLGQMAILYQLDGSVQMRHYDDMIVEACGCL